MKKIIALWLSIVMLLSIGLYGCKEKDNARTDPPTPAVNENTEQPAAKEPKEEQIDERDILSITSSQPEPNYEFQLYQADDVIYGEVVEEMEGYYSNPDRTKEVMNAWITPYVIKIEKAYKDFFKEGDTVVVCVWNKTGIYPEDEEKYAKIITDQVEYYLHTGQRGVFLVKGSKHLKTKDGEPIYDLVYRQEGVFLPKETGNSATDPEAKTVYASPSFEITLDQIPKDIETMTKNRGKKSEGKVIDSI